MIRRTLWSLLAQCQTLLTSEVEWNRASSSLQPYLEFSSLSCWSKHLEMQQRASTLGPSQTESSKSKWNVCVIFSFPTVKPLPPTQPKTFRSSWTASARPAKALDWPSALRKHRSWLRIWTHLPILQSWGMNGRLSMTSYTLAKRSLSHSNYYHFKLDQDSMVKKKVTESTNIQVYSTCVLSTLLHDSESWTLHARTERTLTTFQMRCLRRILSITWQDKVRNNTVLQRPEIPSMYTLLKQRRLRRLGHVVRMDYGQTPNDLLHGELTQGKHPTGRPQLRYKDVCKRDLKALGIDINGWETLASERWLEARSRVRPLRVWRDTCWTGWDKETNEEAGCAKTIDDVRSSGTGRNLARTCKPLTTYPWDMHIVRKIDQQLTKLI